MEMFDPVEGSFRSVSFRSVLSGIPYRTWPVAMTDGQVLLTASPQGGVVFDQGMETTTSVGSDVSSDADVVGAVALPDGRVLVVGYLQASIFDPGNGEFISVDPVYRLDRGVALTLLQDGRVLLTGGDSGPVLDDQGTVHAQVFDPVTDLFTAVAPMLEPRSHHTAITLADGRVVVIGGAEGRVEIFDPDTGIFATAPELSRSRDRPSVTLLEDGSLLVVGGWDEGADTLLGYRMDVTTFRTAEIYHPSRRSHEPSKTSLSGFTITVEGDPSWDRLAERPTGNLSLLLDVPAGGLEGLTYAHASWEIHDSVNPQRIAWVGTDGRTWNCCDDTVRGLPEDCELGCEIREVLSDGWPVGARPKLYLHLQYQGEIPEEANGMTLTLVEGNT